jgi:hypothetical protein
MHGRISWSNGRKQTVFVVERLRALEWIEEVSAESPELEMVFGRMGLAF